MTPVDKLLARAEICDLFAAYCINFDDQNWEAFAELWADDAVFMVEAHAFAGKTAVLDFLSTCLPKGYVSKHMISQPLIELAEDGLTARARTDVVWIAANFQNAIVGRYIDELVKADGRWKFLRRREIPVPYHEGLPPMSETAQLVSGSTMHQELIESEKP